VVVQVPQGSVCPPGSPSSNTGEMVSYRAEANMKGSFRIYESNMEWSVSEYHLFRWLKGLQPRTK